MGFLSKLKQKINPDPDYPLIKTTNYDKSNDPFELSNYPLELDTDVWKPKTKSSNQRYLERYDSRYPDELPPRNWATLSDEDKIAQINQTREADEEKIAKIISDRKNKLRKKRAAKSTTRKPAKKVIKKCKCKK